MEYYDCDETSKIIYKKCGSRNLREEGWSKRYQVWSEFFFKKITKQNLDFVDIITYNDKLFMNEKVGGRESVLMKRWKKKGKTYTYGPVFKGREIQKPHTERYTERDWLPYTWSRYFTKILHDDNQKNTRTWGSSLLVQGFSVTRKFDRRYYLSEVGPYLVTVRVDSVDSCRLDILRPLFIYTHWHSTFLNPQQTTG